MPYKTKILLPTNEHIQIIASSLKGGGVAAFPTETVYGLGASAFDENAVKKIFEVKGRPCDNPLIVHVQNKNEILKVALEIPLKAQMLIDAFSPGPLTYVLKKLPSVSSVVTGKLDTVAVRIPSNKLALELIGCAGVPLCAPSANTSSKPSPTTASHVFEDLNGKIEYILDGGKCSIGVESTVIDMSKDIPVILREGGISKKQIESVIGRVETHKGGVESPPSPGMKYKHYTPKAQVFFAKFSPSMSENIIKEYDLNIKKNPVIMCFDNNIDKYEGKNVIKMGISYEDYAHNLFASLREADGLNYGLILAEGVTSEGIGAAIINRLTKASERLI